MKTTNGFTQTDKDRFSEVSLHVQEVRNAMTNYFQISRKTVLELYPKLQACLGMKFDFCKSRQVTNKHIQTAFILYVFLMSKQQDQSNIQESQRKLPYYLEGCVYCNDEEIYNYLGISENDSNTFKIAVELLVHVGAIVRKVAVYDKNKANYYFVYCELQEEKKFESETIRRTIKNKKQQKVVSEAQNEPIETQEEEVRPITPKEDKIECEPIVEEIEGVHVEKTQTEMIIFLEAYDNHLEGVSDIYDDLVAKINALDSYDKEFVIDMAKRFRQEIRDKFNDEQITAFYEKIICEINFC